MLIDKLKTTFMTHPIILNLNELLHLRKGLSYKNQIAILYSSGDTSFNLDDHNPVYVNAFTYMIVEQGSALLKVNNDYYQLSSGSFSIFSPPNLTRFSHLSTDFSCYFLVITKDFLDSIATYHIKKRIIRRLQLYSHPITLFTQDEYENLIRNIKALGDEFNKHQHHYQDDLVKLALIRFYIELDNIYDNHQPCPLDNVCNHRQDELLRHFFDLLTTYFRTEQYTAFYAEQLHITTQYLNRIVKARTGNTAATFLDEMRYSEARFQLSMTDKPIAVIAEQLAFSDASAFTKYFKRMSGYTPYEYRSLIDTQITPISF